MLAGPSIATCFNSADGMGMCLRGKMADAGILPKPAVAAVEPAVVAPVETAIAEPQLDVAPAPGTPAKPAADLIGATFGLLRAEPDGSMVIAGSGTPGSEVEVYSNGDLLGKAKVETSGDWVLVPAAPIPPGGTELTLAEAGKPGRAAESFVVVVNDDKKSEPLVVASTPGTASEVLQGLTKPAAGTTTEVATAEPQPKSEPAVPAAEPAVTPPAAQAAVVPPAAEPAVAAPAVTEPAAPVAETAAPEAATPDVAASDSPAVDTPTAPATTEVPAVEPEMAVAEAAPAVVTPAPAAPVVASDATPPTIDAIEIEGERSFFAGSGPEGAVVRLYIDGTYIDDATVADGRWLVEAGNVLTKPTQRVRVDLLKPGTADVAARAEVDFKVDLPTEAPTAIAAAEPAPTVAAPAETKPEPAVEAKSDTPNAVAAPDEKAAEVANIDDTPHAAQADKSATIENRPGEAVTSAPVPAPVEAAQAPAAAAAETQTAAPEIASPAVTPPAQPEPSVAETPVAVEPDATAVETPAAETQVAEQAPVVEGDVPTMTAVAVGDPDTARFAAGKAIIRHGDNLWTIARRVYGSGIKYTTIYEANTGQIRNPDRIYPGQVFDLPKSAE